ncbi:MAG TPA: peptidylprolyl isomerase [Clostridia bacterium]
MENKEKNKEKKKMTTDMKIFTAVCAVIVIIIAVAIVYLVTPKDVAIVKNGKVTADEFKYYYNQNLNYLLNFAGQSADQETLILYAKQTALSDAVEVEYLLQEAKKNSFTVDASEINEQWKTMEENIIKSAESYGVSVDEFCKQVLGIGLNKYKSVFKDQYIAQKYREEKINSVPVSEEDLKAYYEENKQSIDYASVRHILVNCEKEAEQAVEEEKSKKAQDILDRVNNGEDFAALAEEFSEDDGSKYTGGIYQVRQNGQFVAEFEQWAFSHEPGDTGIIRSEYGFHVMKLEDILNTLESQLEIVTLEYKNNIYQTAMNEAFTNGEYKIEVKEGFNEF